MPGRQCGERLGRSLAAVRVCYASALDPLAEYAFNQKIHGLSRDKTVIFISHRLSTVKMADYIYLLDGWRINCGGE